ncbi:Crossover junction endodeoxyribonuclease [Micromonospora saelicesensis]|uniref:Crossover junction endodeoxyribonuclease n=1 Tax=Micromonospora saelicesensis TaxID=285676 RepID=A0A328NH29_9ACTN|nr:RusA family crossover junction endodeoxyribonuclease [Micromonospora saelicesensis]RAO26495.1 Crossover junction endodeoxyribonuclease [Micromonospora saelicesensis]
MTAPLLTITAYGLPAPQGSKRHVGRGVMVESSKNVKPWREAVKAAALDMRPSGWRPIDAPLVVSMVFTFARPKGHYRTGRNAHLLRDAAPVRPATVPDLSKLIRSTEDALTDAGIWRDDCLVVRYTDTGKAYPAGDELALTSPGVVIRIWPLADACAHEWHGADGGRCPGCGWDSHPIPAGPAVIPAEITAVPKMPAPLVVPYQGGRHTGTPTIDLLGQEAS